MSDYNKSNGIGGLSVAGNFSAAAATLGKSRGIVLASIATPPNVFGVILSAAGGGMDALRTVYKASVTGAVPGVAELQQLSDSIVLVSTWSAAGAAVALPFNLTGKPKSGGGKTTYAPAGNVVVSALVDVVATVPTLVGPARGLVTPTAPLVSAAPAVVRTGAGVYTVTLDPGGIDPLNAVVTVRPADTALAPADRIVVAEHVSDTSIIVRAFDGGTPADSNFYLHVERIAVG